MTLVLVGFFAALAGAVIGFCISAVAIIWSDRRRDNELVTARRILGIPEES